MPKLHPVSVYTGLLLAVYLYTCVAIANVENEDAEGYFRQGMELYDAAAYEKALPAFLKAVELSPMQSNYHHMLGKCYGRIAEHGSWFTALRTVGKTLAELERAVELDAENIQAWQDLEEFYRRAPGFLGGSKEKAREIRERLRQSANTTDGLPVQ